LKFAALILFFLLSTIVQAKLIEVCPTCRVKSVAQALELAQAGDEVCLQKGIYTEHGLIINKPIVLCGEEGAIIDGGGLAILFVKHDSVTIRDLTLRNVSTNYIEDRAAIKGLEVKHLEIIRVNIYQSFFGILLEKSSEGLISHCFIEGSAEKENYQESANGNAIHLWYCKNMKVEHNTTLAHRDGIYFEFVENSSIEHNFSKGNMRYGLHFMFSHHNQYRYNIFEHNGAGVAVMYSTNVLMEHNEFRKNWGESSYGLLLKDITDSEMRHNIFYSNTMCISADNVMRVNMHHNVFLQNGYAMRIMGNCSDNVVHHNDFLENSFDIVTNARSNYNTFENNYWDNNNGYDMNRDGIADQPYRPVKLFTYIITQAPAAIILMRSTFIDLLNLAEKITPVLTPESLIDNSPKMRPINDFDTRTYKTLR
jgi:nitrous oxidase accessory protein